MIRRKGRAYSDSNVSPVVLVKEAFAIFRDDHLAANVSRNEESRDH